MKHQIGLAWKRQMNNFTVRSDSVQTLLQQYKYISDALLDMWIRVCALQFIIPLIGRCGRCIRLSHMRKFSHTMRWFLTRFLVKQFLQILRNWQMSCYIIYCIMHFSGMWYQQ